jgi:hypothetical protein
VTDHLSRPSKPSAKLVGKFIPKLPSKLLSKLPKELAERLITARKPELAVPLNALLRPGPGISLRTPLAAELSRRLGTKLLRKQRSEFISGLLPGPLRWLTRWLLPRPLPMWGVELRLMRLTL